MTSLLEQHLAKRRKIRRFRAMAVGFFVDKEHTLWSESTKAYGSVKDYIRDVGTDDPYYDYLADSLHVSPRDLPEYLAEHDDSTEMCTLIRALLYTSENIAIKGFLKYRDAENFLSLLEQLDFEVPPDPETEALLEEASSRPAGSAGSR